MQEREKGMHRGFIVYNLRIKQGLSLKELGRKANLDPGTISRYERGIQDLKAENIIKLARALYTDPNYMLGWGEYDL